MHKLFDTHAHYTDERLKDKPELLSSIFGGDVSCIVTVASSIGDSKECISLAEKYDGSRDEMAEDVRSVISKLRKIGAIVE